MEQRLLLHPELDVYLLRLPLQHGLEVVELCARPDREVQQLGVLVLGDRRQRVSQGKVLL